MSNTTAALQGVASVDDFLNAAATETVPLFEHFVFEFLLKYDVFAPTSRERTRVHRPPELFRGFLHCYYKNIYGTRRLHENSGTGSSGTTIDSTNRHPETRLIAFSPTSNTLLTMSSTGSSSRPLSSACPTPRTLSIRPTSKRSNTTTLPRGTTIQQPRSTTTASAVRSSRPGQRSR